MPREHPATARTPRAVSRKAGGSRCEAAPDELGSACVVLTAPPEPFVPEELRGKPVLGMAALYVGDVERVADTVRPLKDLGPVVDLIGPMPYTDFQAALDPFAPRGFRNYWRGE